MSNYKFELKAGQSLYIDADRNLLVETMRKYLNTTDDPQKTTETLKMITNNINTLDTTGEADEFLEDLSEIVAELLEEKAIDFLKSDREAWNKYSEGGKNQKKIKRAERYTLGSLLESTTYNDLIGQTHLRFGRDVSFDSDNPELRIDGGRPITFNWNTFTRKTGIPTDTHVVSDFPLRILGNISKSKRDAITALRKQYKEAKGDAKEGTKKALKEQFIELTTLRISWSLPDYDDFHAEISVPPIKHRGKDTIELLRDAKRDKINRIGVRSGQWRINSLTPNFTKPTEDLHDLSVNIPALTNFDYDRWLETNFDNVVMSDEFSFSIMLEGADKITKELQKFVDRDMREKYINADIENLEDLDTLYAFKYELKLVQPKPVTSKTAQHDASSSFQSDEEGERLYRKVDIDVTDDYYQLKESEENPIGKNDFAELGNRKEVYVLRRDKRTTTQGDRPALPSGLPMIVSNKEEEEKLRTRFETIEQKFEDFYTKGEKVFYEGNYVNKSTYNRKNKGIKEDARLVKITPEEYKKLNPLQQQAYMRVKGEKTGETYTARTPKRTEPTKQEEKKEVPDDVVETDENTSLENALEKAVEALKNLRVRVFRYSDRLGKYDFSPYSREGERENEAMREHLSEFVGNLRSLERKGIEIEGV
jgi:hypothetical protein